MIFRRNYFTKIWIAVPNTEGLLWTARRAQDEHSAGFTDSDFGGVIDAVTFGQRRLQNSRAG